MTSILRLFQSAVSAQGSWRAIIECCSFAAMAKQTHLFLSKNIRHFRPINVIDFHNIHLCHLFGGRHLCMLCCSNIVLTFLTRILTKLPKSAHFWLSFEPLEKSSFFKGECQNTLIQLWFWADKTAWKRYEKTTKVIMVEKTRNFSRDWQIALLDSPVNTASNRN